MRDQFAPEPNAPGAKVTVCEHCGNEFWQWEGKYIKQCSACGAARCTASITASRTKEGPGWEKVVRGQLRRWLAEAERLGLTLDA